MDTILKHNNFVFNSEHYLQVFGTAMGVHFAPSMACLFMGQLEERLLSSSQVKPHTWLRFIDDIFILWTDGEESFKNFVSLANDFHHSIKFTSEHSPSSIPFLDVQVSLQENHITTDLYSKPTDTHQYIQWTSCHPRHTKSSLPYCLAFRLRRLCSSEETLSSRMTNLKDQLRGRGYPSNLVTKEISKAIAIPREQALQLKDRQNEQISRTPLVLTFHPAFKDVSNTIFKFLPILHSSTYCKDIFQQPPMAAFRRPPNIKDALVRSSLSALTPPTKGFVPCGKCAACTHQIHGKGILSVNHTYQSSLFTSFTNNKAFGIKIALHCLSYNVVYLITCRSCKKQYIGETGRSFKIRLLEHCADTRHRRDKPVANHFNLPGHSSRDISAIPIDKPRSSNPTLRKTLEHHWIHTMQTVTPQGINVKTE